MAKSKAKRKGPPESQWASLPWKTVQVGKGSADITNDVNDKAWTSNHYDNPGAKTSDLYDDKSKGLDYIEGANDPGIFLGLEVIDGSLYEVEKLPVSGGSAKLETKGFVNRLVIKDVNDLMQEEATKDGSATDSVTKSATKAPDRKIEEAIAPKNGEFVGKNLTRKEKNKLKLEKLKAKRKEIKLKKKRKREQANVILQPESENASSSDKPKKKKVGNRNAEFSDPAKLEPATEQQIASIQVPWSIATGGVYLHPILCEALYHLNFSSPTPIQSSTLAASILGRRDIVGAAPTGSGKTLSYLLPILHHLFSEYDEKSDEGDNLINLSYPLTGLILVPTRELAMQVSMEFFKLVSNATTGASSHSLNWIQCGTIVGGLSEQKQKRVLDVRRPPVLVGTPGRLWDLMATGDHQHLTNLDKLRFLVVDEADRMISQGSFPQLNGIFEKIQQANPSLEYMRQHAENDYDSDLEDDDRMLGLPGLPGEAKVTMLDDNLLKKIERQRKGLELDARTDSDDESFNDDSDDAVVQEPIEIDDDEYDAENLRLHENLERMDESNEEEEEEKKVKRQTFIFSATLTLSSSLDQSLSSAQSKRKKGKKDKLSIDGALAEILKKVGAQGETKIVDLSISSSSTKTSQQANSGGNIHAQRGVTQSKIQLPPGLSLYEILCTQKHKDSHLYSFLVTTKQGSAGPALVFCNSIGAVKRVGETLKVLGLPVKMLHAQMQQKARLAALESLNQLNSRAIVVATDVAARGLDIPSVASVVHYDVARTIDTFVHRAGRTARGVGVKAIGWSISLVSAPEEKKHISICRVVLGALSKSFATAPMDGRLLSNAQERVNLASKVVACEDAESKTNKKNQWFIDAAKEAGLDLDENLLDEGQLGGSKKDRQQYLEAKRARQDLKILLAKPLRKQAFGKFLSNAGLRDAIQAENEVKPHVVQEDKKRRKAARKKT